MLRPALEAAAGLDATVANMRFVKPLDTEMLRRVAENHELLVTVEEHAVMGGAGSAVCEALAALGIGHFQRAFRLLYLQSRPFVVQ